MKMATTFKDYYEILSVDHKATNEEIKTAYLKAARKYHPDLHIKSEKAAAEEKFKEVNEAYEVLGDPEKRAKYDRLGEDRRSGQEQQSPPDMGGHESYTWNGTDNDSFSDFFESMFGRTKSSGFTEKYGKQKTMRGENLESHIELSLEEAYHGGQKNFQFSLRKRCPACGGTGAVGPKICQSCSGTGYKVSVKKLDVKIPIGIRDGNKIRLKGQGGEGAGGGEQGDLLLTVKILPNAIFTLNGNHLETKIKIRPEQAVLGSNIPAPTLDGQVIITVPPMSHNGQKLRLRSKGWPGKGEIRGDQYVEVSIDIPHLLSQAEREIYQSIAKLRKEVHNQ
jgi:curved DNA-binding protein